MSNKKSWINRINKKLKSSDQSYQQGSGNELEHWDHHAGQGEGELGIERSKKMTKAFKQLGTLCLVLGLVGIFYSASSSVDSSQAARNALQNHVSTAVSAGTVLLSADENIGAQDYTIVHSSTAEETKIWVWDYAAEDGDYVQILVNGTPITAPFMIKHKPREIMVPAVGDIQIKGIRDGGGGITYAVRYELNGTSYFNSAPEGEYNTYTLVRE